MKCLGRRGKYIIYKVFLLIIFVAIFVAANEFLSFVMETPVNCSRWQDYELTESGESYDLVAFGPSDCRSGFDPDVADEILGCHSFNYGHAAASYSAGVKANIDYILRVQNPKTVLLYVIGNTLYSEGIEPVEVYNGIAQHMSSVISRLYYYTISSLEGGAISRFAIWQAHLFERDIEGNIDRIVEYWQMREEPAYKNYDASFLSDHWKSMGYRWKGYYTLRKGVADEFDYDNVEGLNLDNPGKYMAEDVDMPMGSSGKGLVQIIRKLKKKNIRTVVLIGPDSLIDIYRNRKYYCDAQNIKAIAEENGCEFYDMNFLKKEIWRPTEGDWHDENHLLDNGVAEYTKALAMVLKAAAEGEDTSKYFYPNWQEFTESIDEIQAVGFEESMDDETVHLEAFSVVGPLVSSEYSFVLIDENEEQTVLRDFQTDNELVINIDDIPEGASIRIYGRNRDNIENVRYIDYRN